MPNKGINQVRLQLFLPLKLLPPNETLDGMLLEKELTQLFGADTHGSVSSFGVLDRKN